MNKKRAIVIVPIWVIAIIIAWFIGTGFTKRTDVWLVQHNVSEDGSSISLKVAVASSMGYIRDCDIKQVDDKKYIAFYSCFGGFNSNIGAKTEFIVDIEPACKEIYFYGGDEGYNLVFQKNTTTNEWETVK
ncbi:MAG: hypothetical protein RSA77_02575 [Clostridium sp.]